MSIYNCNPDWPVCLYDFTFKNRNPNFFTYKVKRNLTDYMKDDYYPIEPLVHCLATKEKPIQPEIDEGDSELLVVRN